MEIKEGLDAIMSSTNVGYFLGGILIGVYQSENRLKGNSLLNTTLGTSALMHLMVADPVEFFALGHQNPYSNDILGISATALGIKVGQRLYGLLNKLK